MKNSGLKNEIQVSKILSKGSSALKNINEDGYHRFKDYDLEDGILAGKLLRPNYNIIELQKAVDTTITELLPIKKPTPPDVVLRSIYDEALATIDILTNEIQELNELVLELRSRILELELLNNNLSDENNSRVLQLEAMVAALTTERDLLRDQLFGRMGRIQEGDIVGTDFSVRILTMNEQDNKSLIYYRRINPTMGNQWINGGEIEIINFTQSPVTVTVDVPDVVVHRSGPVVIRSGQIISVTNITSNIFTIPSEERVGLNFVLDGNALALLPPFSPTGFNKLETYEFSVTFTSNSGSVVNLPVIIRKERKLI